MNDAVILQHCWSSNAWTAPLSGMFYDQLRLTLPRHSAYARAHNFDYWVLMGGPVDPDPHPTGAWGKVYMMRDALKRGYQYVAWIDTDAAIMDMDCDLRDAMPGGKLIAACLHDPEKSEYLRKLQVPAHYNVGVMYLRNGPGTIEFVEDWLASHPGDPRWQEQGAFNDLVTGKYADAFARADDKWNATVNVNMVDKPAIVGWHGIMSIEYRLSLMMDAMRDDFIKFRV